jgi:L-asparaginase II
MQLPWQPLFTIERSGKPEVSVYGIISVLDGLGKPILALGDVNYELWSRSCLKPWQLLGHYLQLKDAYPGLSDAHFALMESSHNGEPFHLEHLREIMAIGQVGEELLKCPACHSWHALSRAEQKRKGEPESSLLNGCSGKHFGLIMAMKARGQDVSDYINPYGEQFLPLKQMLACLLGRASLEFATTVDGCRLPNYALSVKELSWLYSNLVNGVSKKVFEDANPELRPALAKLAELGELMRRFPALVGGTDRLDSRLIQGALTDDPSLEIVAKEGADGLLCVGVGASKAYPAGLGIAIKISSGYEVHHLESIAKNVLEQLGLRSSAARIDPANRHIATKFHFQLERVRPLEVR